MRTQATIMGLLLLLATGVEAGERANNETVYLEGLPCRITSEDMRGKIVAYCGLPNLKGALIVDVFPDPCLAKLKAAMKAMDWYLPVGMQPIGEGRWQSYMQVSDEGHEAIRKALKEWDAVRLECWRTP